MDTDSACHSFESCFATANLNDMVAHQSNWLAINIDFDLRNAIQFEWPANSTQLAERNKQFMFEMICIPK